MKAEIFHIADWTVNPATNSIVMDGERRQVEPRAMDVLQVLCERAGEVVGADELLLACWGSLLHGDNPIHKTITQLRQVLGDNARAPVYIETIRKRGYRVIATVAFERDDMEPPLGSWQHGSPFRGLQSFSESDAPIFFGRRDATQRLVEMVTRQTADGRGLALVLGPSGCGKTSLVHAGLLPALLQAQRHDGAPVPLAVSCLDLADMGSHALASVLGSALLDWQIGDVDVFPGYSGATLGEALSSRGDEVAAALQRVMPAASGRARLVLFIDRFEVVFTSPHIDEAARKACMSALDMLARSGAALVVLACRNDFYPRLVQYPVLMDAKTHGGHFDLAPPSGAELAQIIRLPALAANLSFGVDPASQARLDDVLCADTVGNPDALPLLQHTLQELFRLRSASGELSFEALRHLGGVEGAIGQRAEEVVGALTAQQRGALPRVWSLLVCLSGTDDGVTGRRAPWSALRDAAERDLVTALVEARLFVSELVGDEPGFGVAHEALLRRWPRVTRWIDTHRQALRVRGRIADQAARWAGEGRPSDLLLPLGMQLDEARRLHRDQVFSLSPDELDLIERSAARARWRSRWRVGAVSAIVGLAVIASAFGWSAQGARQVAEQRRAEAEGLMGFMLGDFSDKLRPLGRLDLLDSVSGKALQYLAGSDAGSLSGTSLTQRAKALQVIAEVHVARGNTAAALDALHAARAILLRQLAAAPNEPEVVKNLGANAFWEGQIHLDRSNWAEAQRLFLLYQQYSDRLYAIDPGSIDAWIEQSYAHTNLGMLALKRDQPDVAAAELERSLVLKTRALARRPHDRALTAELANTLSWLGSAQEASGALVAASRIYARELQVVTELHAAAPGDALWTNRVANSLQRRSKLALALGQEDTAMAAIEQARALLDAALEREPNNRVWRANLAIVELDRLRLLARRERAAALLPALTALGAKTLALTRLDPKKADWSRLHALTGQATAVALRQAGHVEAARALIGQSVNGLEQLYRNNPSDWRIASELAKTLLSMADIASAARDQPAALASCERAGRLLGATAAHSGDYRVLDPWVRSQFCLNNNDIVATARARLHQMGYREASYLRYVTAHQ